MLFVFLLYASITLCSFQALTHCSSGKVRTEKVAPLRAIDSFAKFFDDALTEVDSPTSLPVIGEIPSYLSGTLIKNGPGVFGALEDGENKQKQRYTHIFDGLAKLTRYEFKNKQVLFSSRFIRSKWFDKIVTKRGPLPPSVTTAPVEPPFSTWQNVKSLLTATDFDNVPVNVAQIGAGGPWVGVTDAPVVVPFDLKTLETAKDPLKFSGSITSPGGVELFSTAHPHLHQRDGCLYNYFLELRPIPIPFQSKSNIAHIVKTNSKLERTVVGSVEVGAGVIPYIHDFSMTDRFAVLIVYPLRAPMAALSNGGGFLRQLEWLGDKGVNTQVHVFDLRAHKIPGASLAPIRSFEAPPMFSYHHLNAYEEIVIGGTSQIVLDLTGYSTPEIVNGDHAFAYIHNMRDPQLRAKQARDGQCFRFVLPVMGQGASPSGTFIEPTVMPIQDASGTTYTAEMVRINEAVRGRKHRFSYGMSGFAGGEEEPNRGGYQKWALIKRDHLAAERISEALKAGVDPKMASLPPSAFTWALPNCFPSEPIFVADPAGSAEDDGVLLSEVYDAGREESFLVVLDARSMKEVARTYIGSIRPYPFHGQFVPAESTRR